MLYELGSDTYSDRRQFTLICNLTELAYGKYWMHVHMSMVIGISGYDVSWSESLSPLLMYAIAGLMQLT
jgi:hypothetical protein